MNHDMKLEHPKNDFHIALLWLRSMEMVNGHSEVVLMSELEMHDLFIRYRSPFKA
jgi:hypothetical protein